MSQTHTKAEDRARQLLRVIPPQGHIGRTTSELAEITGIPRSAIYYPLAQLRKHGYIIRNEDGLWWRALITPKVDWAGSKTRPVVEISFQLSPSALADPEFQRVFKQYLDG